MTKPPLSTQHQKQLIAHIALLADERAQAEIDIEARRKEQSRHIEESFLADTQRMAREHQTQYDAQNSAYTEALAEARRLYEAEMDASESERQKLAVDATQSRDHSMKKARRRWKKTCRDAENNFKHEVAGMLESFKQFTAQCDERRGELRALEAHAAKVFRRRRCKAAVEALPLQAAAGRPPRALERFEQLMAAARGKLAAIERLPVARFKEEGWPVLLFIFGWLAAIFPAGQLLSWNNWHWLAASGAASLIVTLTVYAAVAPFVRRATLRLAPELRQMLTDADAALTAAVQSAKIDLDHKCAAVAEVREATISDAHAAWSSFRIECAQAHEARIRAAVERYQNRRSTAKTTWDETVAALQAEYPPRLAQMNADHQQAMQQRQADHAAAVEQCQRDYEQSWAELAQRWRAGVAELTNQVGAMNEYCRRRFPQFDNIDWTAWTPPDEELPAVRFGQYQFGLEMLENGVPEDPRLPTEATDFELPAFLSFPQCPSLLLEAEGEGRDAANAVIQNVMLRLLTSLPPGKVRFTILDPVGLGRNFSAFMHLADFDERLVANRIWTEPAHIKQRLTDLSEHMENVIQKYLRNEFESIQQYNRSAGEVAEPFQILVAANFPVNFSEETARRLASIAASGARCGVYTLISTDQKMKLPRNFDLADLEAHAAVLVWREGRFQFKDEHLSSLPLSLDAPPDDETFTTAVRAAGRLAKDASRVEVPFNTVVPPIDHWWASDSRAEIDVPLGRAGAVKLQHMHLGTGTSQHVLISGKTGSGKSTLLHAMITNLAIHYSPDELHFYLIDFKKGVEFKPYARFGLPHARVIAIESEREFGMSVLERLDAELRRRGDLFRAAGAQDVRAYRDANPDVSMPRVLLIIDEFQEFFVKDDRIAQEASLLLDRLVRQGRAFGIHVILGSQTLAGAYSLARSTIGQMAVRIALQCSEGDAHLILSEENTAARLLTRPGEAIYNNANGLFEGNHPFQVVWLPDEQRENFLRRIEQLARQRHTAAAPPIVFEGNVAADIADNLQLREALETAPSSKQPPRAWLGAAVAIKEPTEALFRRHSGANLLVVGQQETMATGVLASSVISLAAAQADRSAAQFYVLDGARPESPEAGYWRRFASRLPINLQCFAQREAADALAQVSAEVDRRLQAGDETAPPVYLVIYNLARFRDLKVADDDFGFSADSDKPQSPDKQLAHILREGPAWGVHVLLWCDSYNNTLRWLGRQTLRDLEMRVLFQMSGGDSSNLMDSPAASHLGAHRAFLYSDESGAVEKLRPYGAPSDDFLAWAAAQLENRPAKAARA